MVRDLVFLIKGDRNMKCIYLKIVFSFLTFIVSSSVYSQKEFADKINLYNEKGEKNGFWIEQKNGLIFELYYKNGVKDGLYRMFNTKKDLQYFGTYDNGMESGIWYSFGDYGHLVSCESDFSINETRISYNEGQTWHLHTYKCHYKSFYPNGSVEKEGTLLWTEDPLMDDSVEYGEWKYYDENGELTVTKFFDEFGKSHLR